MNRKVSAVETKHRPAVESSEAAMRAAQAIINHFSSRYSNGSDTCFSCAYADHQLPEIAAIIDREMHCSEMKDALTDAYDELADALGEWASVEHVYLPADKVGLKQIYNHISTALEHLTTAPTAPATPEPSHATFEEAWVLRHAGRQRRGQSDPQGRCRHA